MSRPSIYIIEKQIPERDYYDGQKQTHEEYVAETMPITDVPVGSFYEFGGYAAIRVEEAPPDRIRGVFLGSGRHIDHALDARVNRITKMLILDP